MIMIMSDVSSYEYNIWTGLHSQSDVQCINEEAQKTKSYFSLITVSCGNV